MTIGAAARRRSGPRARRRSGPRRRRGILVLALLMLPGAIACAGLGAPSDPAGPRVDPDAEAVTAALAAHGAALELARLALHRASHPVVRELACVRIREHEAIVEWLSVAAYQDQIPRVRSAAVDVFDAEIGATLAELRSRWGMSFDRGWVVASAGIGGWLSERLDSTTLAGIRSDELRAGLGEIRDGAGIWVDEAGILRQYLVGFHD